jgi:L-fuconolactonase
VDLQSDADLVNTLLGRHRDAAGGRLRGIRNLSADRAERVDAVSTKPSLLMSQSFREGFSHLRSFNLVFDAWMFHTQLGDLADLAKVFPDTTIVLNHLGGPCGIGTCSANPGAARGLWEQQIKRVAACDNVYVKIGGLGMPHCGFGFHELPKPPSSDDLVREWLPFVEYTLQTFGTHRCMFESNFPVDKASFSYITLWNAFKRLTQHYESGERRRLFFENAVRVYRLDVSAT